MAAPLDTDAQNGALDALLGDLAGSTTPVAFELALWDGDPRLTGSAELAAAGGYERVTGITNNSVNFPDAVDGVKTMAPQVFADPTDPWPNPGAWWVLLDAADSVTRWYFGRLDIPLVVSAAGTGVAIRPRIFWNPDS